MKEILDTVRPVVEAAKYVRINSEALISFANGIKKEDLGGSEFNEDTTLQDATEEQRIAYAFIYDAVNFSYWGKPKWALTADGRYFGGSASMMRALKRAVDEGFDVLNPSYLENIPETDLQNILRANVEIPLFSERLRLLRELGKGVTRDFDGSFSSVVERAGYDATMLVKLLVDSFPEVFDDYAVYKGKRVNFYKRAQLVPAHIWDLGRLGLISGEITNLDGLTAFADYKVPQLMRRLGILEYADSLARVIDAQKLIEPGSEQEVEIRAAAIWANELATQEVRKRIPSATAAQVDGVLWFKGQDKSVADKPYHRTRTIWY